MASTSVEAAKNYLMESPYKGYCDCGGLTAFKPEDVEECLAFYEYCPDGWDSESGILVKLKDGRFGVATESSDSSGHG